MLLSVILGCSRKRVNTHSVNIIEIVQLPTTSCCFAHDGYHHSKRFSAIERVACESCSSSMPRQNCRSWLLLRAINFRHCEVIAKDNTRSESTSSGASALSGARATAMTWKLPIPTSRKRGIHEQN